MKFKDWIIFSESIDPQQVVNAALTARKHGGICNRSHFGDCKELSEETLKLLKQLGIPARLSGGTFTTNISDKQSWDHSWIVVSGRWILDVTIDQFFSDLDEDMILKQPGIYYSHPSWDGNTYKDRYYRSAPIAKINL